MTEEALESLSYKELKKKCITLGAEANGTKKQLLFALRSHMKKENKITNQTHAKLSPYKISHKIKPKLSPLPKIKKLKKKRSQSSTHNISMLNDCDVDDDDEELLPYEPKICLPPTTIPKLANKCISAPDVNMHRNTIKMKSLYWNAISPQNIKGSVWEDLNQCVDYDTKHFELHFQVRLQKPLGMDDEKKSTMPFRQRKKIKIVSKKRGQEILAILGEFDINGKELRKILHNMDENAMTLCKLNKLLSIIPTLEQQNKAETTLDINHLNDELEIFFYSLSDFYDLAQRIKFWIFKQEFIEIVDGLISEYKKIGQACDKIKNNKNLRLLLSIILSFGNYMNKETENTVNGFNISILCKLREIKSFDHTHSLLMYIYSFCDKNKEYANAIQILPQLSNILKAAISIEMKMLTQIYDMIMDNLTEINELINSKKIENYVKNDTFIIVLVAFYNEAMTKMKQLNKIISVNTISMKQCMLYFCYGTEKKPKRIEMFFKIWWQFLIDFGCSKQKLIQLEKERQKRIKKRKKLKDIEKKMKLHEKYYRQSTIDMELEKINNFQRHKVSLHGKLKDVVQRRSIFIVNGGLLTAKHKENDTMQRLATHYKAQVKSAQNVSKMLGYDKFIKQTRKRASNRLQYNNIGIAPKPHNNAHTNNAFCLPQSSSDILFAENEEMEGWHSKYIKLEKQCIELKLAQTISDNNNNKLIRKLNEMQKLNEDLLVSINMKTSMEVTDKIKFLNKEMNAFCDMFENDNDKTDLLQIQNELNELDETNKSFQKTMENILCNDRMPNAVNYEQWDINGMILWIKTLDNGQYIKYCNVLQNGFITDGIDNGGQLLVFDDQNDLRNEPFNINSIHDRKALIKHFQSLPALKSKADK